MRNEKRNYVIVGSFVIAMLVMLLLWISLLAGRTGSTDPYYVVFDSVKGLKSGVRILYEGFPMGYIDEIAPVEGEDGRLRFRVDVSVDEGWPIPEDSRAAIAAGLFSAAVVNIRGGESETLLAPGSQIPADDTPDVVAAVNAAASRLTSILDQVSDRTPEVLGNVERFTAELNQSVDQVNRLLGTENVERFERILANFESATTNVNTLIADVGTTRQGVDALIERLDQLLAEEQGDVTQAIDDLKHSLGVVARHIDAVSTNLEATTRNLNEFSRQIRENPGVLIRGRETDDGS